jgi:hypothetical protein
VLEGGATCKGLRATVKGLKLAPLYRLDAALVGERIAIRWAHGKVFHGLVKSFDFATCNHQVVYDDGDSRDYQLMKKKFAFPDLEEKTQALIAFLKIIHVRLPGLTVLDLSAINRVGEDFKLLPFLRWVVDNMRLECLRLPATGQLAQELVTSTRADCPAIMQKPPGATLIAGLAHNLLASLELLAEDQAKPDSQVPLTHLRSIAAQFQASASAAAVFSNQECIYRLRSPKLVLQGESGWFVTAMKYKTLKRDVVTDNCLELIANGHAEETISGAFKIQPFLYNSQPVFAQDDSGSARSKVVSHALYFSQGSWIIGMADTTTYTDEGTPTYIPLFQAIDPQFDLSGRWQHTWAGDFRDYSGRGLWVVLQRSACLA